MSAAGLATLLALGVTGSSGIAQTVVPFSSTTVTPVAPQTATVMLTVTSPGTATSIQVLTQGTQNLDYTLLSAGNCLTGSSYALNATCSLTVSFQPRYPGRRHGAVVLAAVDGTALATSFLEGTGLGGLAVLVAAEINTVAGNGISTNYGTNGDGLPATHAELFLPMGEVTDAAGNLYIADTNNNRIRRVDAGTGIISTVAGGTSPGYGGDGSPGISALLSGPTALALDGAGNLYISDSGNAVIRVLHTGSGVIERIAGTAGQPGAGGNGGPALSANLALPSLGGGMALDTAHALYFSDTGNNMIRKVDLTTGTITRFAGTGTAGSSGDGLPALNAELNLPLGINLGSDGSLYLADLNNAVIRRIAPGGVITRVAGGGTAFGDGGPATSALLSQPTAVALDQADNLYIADASANRIRKVNAATGFIRTIAGNGGQQVAGDGQNSDQAEFSAPYSLYNDGQGNLFIGDMLHNRIREIQGNRGVLKYDPLRVGRTSVAQVEDFENDGNADLHATAAITVQATLDTTSTCTLPETVTGGNFCVLQVAFSPTGTPSDPASGSVTLPSDAANQPAIINLIGKSLAFDPTVVTLTATPPSPSVLGSQVTFKAHVTTQGTSFAGGTVEFYDGATDLGSGPLVAVGVAGNAQFATSGLALGAHTITAIYSGDATNGMSPTSAPLPYFVQQPTSVQLQSNPQSQSVEGSPVVLTAQVTPVGLTSPVLPTGQVIFADNGTPLGPGNLDGTGVATLTVSSLTIGAHSLTASYAGDTNNSTSRSNVVSLQVVGEGSSTTLTTSNADVSLGTPVTFSAQVTGTGTAPATGTVVFKDGGTALGPAQPLNASSGASFTTASLSTGQHTITAMYSGDPNYAGSTSSPLTQTVEKLVTATVLVSSANPSPAGATLVLTATVSTAAGGAGGPLTGTVTFLNGGGTIGTGTVGANGVTTFKTSTLPLGQNTIAAVYNGNMNYLGSNSSPLGETIQQATSATSLTTSLTPSIVEATITLTATVTTNGGLATGVVTFGEGGAALGQAKLNALGVATLPVSSLLVGQHTLTASYGGDPLDVASVSPSITQTVLLHPSNDVLTSSATSLNGGQQVTLISVVQWTDPIVPTGTVTFHAGSLTLGVAPVDSTGVATLTILPQVGDTSISSTYSGDSIFAPSTSLVITITVGSPPQFTISATPTVMTMPTLQHSTVQVTVASVKGFTDKLAFGCLGLPKAATCTFSADVMNLAANGTGALSVVVDTGSPLTAGSVAKNEVPRSSSLLALCGLPAGALFGLLLWKRRGPKTRFHALDGTLLLLCGLAAMTGLAGCGALTINGTAPGTYPFQITAAAQGAGVIEAVNMTLTVTQ